MPNDDAFERPAVVTASAQVRGAELHYDVEGQGPIALFGHGLMSDRWAMEDSRTLDWSPVAAAHRLVRLDWRGHGESTGGTDPDEYTWAALGDDLLALLDVLSPDAPVDAIGCSMGTGSILHAAVKAPHRFRRLVLTAPPTAWETRAAQCAGYEQLALIADSGGKAAIERAFAMQPMQGVLAENDAPMRIDVSDELLATVLRGAARTDLPDPEALRGLTVPTLILSWAGDPGHPVATGEKLHELLPQSEFQVAQRLADVQEWGTVAAHFVI